MRADVNGETYFVGKPALFEELGVPFDGHVASDGGVAVDASGNDVVATVGGETVESLQSEGKTVVLLVPRSDSSVSWRWPMRYARRRNG